MGRAGPNYTQAGLNFSTVATGQAHTRPVRDEKSGPVQTSNAKYESRVHDRNVTEKRV